MVRPLGNQVRQLDLERCREVLVEELEEPQDMLVMACFMAFGCVLWVSCSF